MAPMPKSLSKFRPRTSESRRIPLEREVTFRVPRFENFVTEYSANISATGIFIRTRQPLEPGTEMTLEFKVADDWKLIRGRARVVWVRREDGGPDEPAGMGVRFLEMDPQSRRLIHWMVDKHAREGGETFEFDKLREAAGEALGTALVDDDRDAGAPALDSGRAAGTASGFRPLWLVVAAVAAALVAWWVLWPSDPAPAPPPQPAGAPAAGPATPPPAATQPEATAGPGATVAVGDTIRDWAAAWSAARVNDYLSYYSSSFTPPDGLSRRQWEASRAERLTSPRYIRVAITNLEVEMLAPDRASATFFQTYRSDRFEDTIRKRLELALEDGRWRIVDEQVAG